MQTVLLRTLNQNSILTFGRYSGRKVQELLRVHAFHYLRWYYYNMSKITFTNEILNRLNIKEEWRISKPGKNIGIYIEFKKQFKPKTKTNFYY